MIDKQPTSLTFSHNDGTVPSKFLLAFQILQMMYWLFFLKILANWSCMAGSNFLHWSTQKILSGRMVRDGEKPHVSFKAYNRIKNILYVSIHSYLNRHIFKWYIKKGAMSVTSRRINKCPTPKQRFSDKFPTARTYKIANSWQMPRGDGHAWNWLNHY